MAHRKKRPRTSSSDVFLEVGQVNCCLGKLTFSHTHLSKKEIATSLECFKCGKCRIRSKSLHVHHGPEPNWVTILLESIDHQEHVCGPAWGCTQNNVYLGLQKTAISRTKEKWKSQFSWFGGISGHGLGWHLGWTSIPQPSKPIFLILLPPFVISAKVWKGP